MNRLSPTGTESELSGGVLLTAPKLEEELTEASTAINETKETVETAKNISGSKSTALVIFGFPKMPLWLILALIIVIMSIIVFMVWRRRSSE